MASAVGEPVFEEAVEGDGPSSLLVQLQDEQLHGEGDIIRQRIEAEVSKQLAEHVQATIIVSGLKFFLLDSGRGTDVVADFFARFGEVEEVSLHKLGRSRGPRVPGQYSGAATVQFVDSAGVAQVLSSCMRTLVSRSPAGPVHALQLPAPALAYRTYVRIRVEDAVVSRQKRGRGRRSSFSGSISCIMLGNITDHKPDGRTKAQHPVFKPHCMFTSNYWQCQMERDNRTLVLRVKQLQQDSLLAALLSSLEQQLFYEIQIPLRDIVGGVRVQSVGHGRTILWFRLRHAPSCFRPTGQRLLDLAATDVLHRLGLQRVSNSKSGMERVIDFTGGYLAACSSVSLQLSVDIKEVLAKASPLHYLQAIGVLRRGAAPKLDDTEHPKTMDPAQVAALLPAPALGYFQTAVMNDKLQDAAAAAVSNPEVRWLVETLLASRRLSVDHLRTGQWHTCMQQWQQQLPDHRLLQALRQFAATPPANVYAMHMLGKCVAKQLQLGAGAAEYPSGVTLVRRLLVTPTVVMGLPEEVQDGNRVLRRYSALLERFVRVSFADEHGGRLSFDPEVSRAMLFQRVYQCLRHGIKFAGMHFEFLAYSSSQLRESSAWFFAPTADVSAEDVRGYMGDFSSIRVAAKYGARMGQCFSSTLDTVKLQNWQLIEIDDIERSYADGHTACFSDGVGKISSSVAASVRLELRRLQRLSSTAPPPSAFQFRCLGYKGVLAEDPTLLTGVAMRPSQRKFNAPKTEARLEICKHASYIPGHLNRFVIVLLGARGVEDDVFMQKQACMTWQLDAMLVSAGVAKHVLLQYAGCSQWARRCLRTMLEAGFSPTEPFMQSVLRVIRVDKLQELVSKARIHISDSCCLMGVIDEYGCLDEGQVHIKLRQPGEDSDTVVQGPVVVTKHPAMHCGDVRNLQAIVHPRLSHLRDVIVFSAKGPRPEQHKMSGGDLDGDEYWCCWDPELVPATSNCDPMDHDAGNQPVELTQEVQLSDICDFFVKYMANDDLGAIANSWLAFADSTTLGATSPECLELAQLHSTAVDFAKTGQPAQRGPHLVPMQYPDFMENDTKETYESQKILGKLYRAIKSKAAEAVQHAEDTGNQMYIQLDTDLNVVGWERYERWAQALYDYYCEDLWSMMRQYGVRCEAEMISGQLLTFRNQYYSKRKKQEYTYEISVKIARLQQTYRIYLEDMNADDHGSEASVSTRQTQASGGSSAATAGAFHDVYSDGNDSSDDSASVSWLGGVGAYRNEAHRQVMWAKAYAWYRVAYCQSADSQHPCLSFAWVALPELADIKRANE